MNTAVAVSDLIDALPDALIAIDSRGVILLANTQAEWLFRRLRSDMIGRDLGILLPERFRASHLVRMQKFFEEPRIRPMGVNLPLVALQNDGKEIPVEISLSPMMTENGILVLASIRQKRWPSNVDSR